MRNWKQVKKELLKNKSVYEEYKNLGPEYELISQIIGLRIRRGLTQKELAKRMGTKQSAVARLEAGRHNASVKYLQRTAAALGSDLKFSLK